MTMRNSRVRRLPVDSQTPALVAAALHRTQEGGGEWPLQPWPLRRQAKWPDPCRGCGRVTGEASRRWSCAVKDWRCIDCCRTSQRRQTPASTHRQPLLCGWSQDSLLVVLILLSTVMLHLCSIGQLKPSSTDLYNTRPDILWRLIAGCTLCHALWYMQTAARLIAHKQSTER